MHGTLNLLLDLQLYNLSVVKPAVNLLFKRKNFSKMAFEITDSNFQTDVADKGGVAVMDFWAQWCGPCRLIAPIIDKLSTEYDGKAIIGKVDVDNNPEIAMTFKVRSIPTIVILLNGEEVERHVGVTTQAHLAKLIEKHLAVAKELSADQLN
ncbi:MAG: thioredoxin [Saprospiraceae bacterium]